MIKKIVSFFIIDLRLIINKFRQLYGKYLAIIN